MGVQTWLAEGYSYRIPICVHTPVAGANPYLNFTVPPVWDAFWTTVLSSGFDIVFYMNGSGVVHTRSGWTYASRVGTFKVQIVNYTAEQDVSELLWMYWGKAGAIESSAAITETSLAGTSLVLANPEVTDLVVARREAPGATTPLKRFSKTTWEDRMIWWDVTDLFGEAHSLSYTRIGGEWDLRAVDWNSTAGSGVYLAGARQDALTVQGSTQFIEVGQRFYVGMFVQDGTVNVDYTLSLRIRLDSSSLLGVPTPYAEARALLQVRDPSEA